MCSRQLQHNNTNTIANKSIATINTFPFIGNQSISPEKMKRGRETTNEPQTMPNAKRQQTIKPPPPPSATLLSLPREIRQQLLSELHKDREGKLLCMLESVKDIRANKTKERSHHLQEMSSKVCEVCEYRRESEAAIHSCHDQLSHIHVRIAEDFQYVAAEHLKANRAVFKSRGRSGLCS